MTSEEFRAEVARVFDELIEKGVPVATIRRLLREILDEMPEEAEHAEEEHEQQG